MEKRMNSLKMLASASTLAFAMVLSAAYADPNTSTGQGNAQNGTASTTSTGQGNAQDGTATTSGNTVASNNNLSRTSTSTNSNNDTSTDTSTSTRTSTSTSTRNVSADNGNTTASGNTTTTNRDTGNNQSRNTNISADNGNNQSRTIDSGNTTTNTSNNSSTHNSTHTVTNISTVSTDDLRGTVSGINTTLADHGTTAATGAIAGSTYSGFAGIVTATSNTGVGSINQAATSIAANANVTFGTP
jgi:hypothetical protein